MEEMKYNEEVHEHCTCQKSNLHNQFCRTTPFKNGSAKVGIKLYNKLPNTIKRIKMVQEFKRRLKYFLLQHIFYSVDEYISISSSTLLNFLLLCTLFLVLSNFTKRGY